MSQGQEQQQGIQILPTSRVGLTNQGEFHGMEPTLQLRDVGFGSVKPTCLLSSHVGGNRRRWRQCLGSGRRVGGLTIPPSTGCNMRKRTVKPMTKYTAVAGWISCEEWKRLDSSPVDLGSAPTTDCFGRKTSMASARARTAHHGTTASSTAHIGRATWLTGQS